MLPQIGVKQYLPFYSATALMNLSLCFIDFKRLNQLKDKTHLQSIAETLARALLK